MRRRTALGLTAAQWAALGQDEQIMELAWDQYQQHELDWLLVRLREQEMNTPEVVTLITLAKLGML